MRVGTAVSDASSSSAVSDAIVLILLMVCTMAIMSERVIFVIADVDAEARDIDVAMTPEKEEGEDWLGAEIKDTVEDGLGVRRDNVTALTQSPADRVKEPQEDGPDTRDNVDSMDISAEVFSVGSALEEEGVDDEEECGTAEYEETPLVASSDQGTDQTSNDHDQVHDDDVEEGWPWHRGGEEDIQDQ
jgi:hypothetical protein